MRFAMLICGVEDEWNSQDAASFERAMDDIRAWVSKWGDAGQTVIIGRLGRRQGERQGQLLLPGRFAPEPVDRLAPGRGNRPAGGVVGHTTDRPAVMPR